MTKRSRDEIFASILQCATQDSNGYGITRMMYNTFLSYTQLRECLEELTRFGLLVFQYDNKKFKITEKGIRFIHLVEEMDDILKVKSRPNE
jgi:predicted transcriptional regulator